MTYIIAIENSTNVTTKQMREALKAVKALRAVLKWFPTERKMADGPDEMEEFLKTIIVTTVSKVKKVPGEKLVSASESNAASE